MSEEQEEERALAPISAGHTTRRDFAGTSLAVNNAATEALVAKERADQEARWIMAMRAPRNMHDVRQDVIKECKRKGFAEVATYSRPVGSEKNAQGQWEEKFADGLSIRFAEVAMRCMRNMETKATTTYDDARVRMVTVSAVDYETNATWRIDLTISKTVERRSLRKGQRPIGERVNSFGDVVYVVEANDQQVAVKAAAEISKAARTCILRLIPGEIQDEAFDLCRQVAADTAAKDPKATTRRMLDGFGEKGVRPSEVEQWLGHSVEAATRDELLELSRILSGLREGELNWSELVAERIAGRAAAKAPAPAQPAGKPATPSKSGKGTDALKAAVSQVRAKAQPPAAPTAEAEPAWMRPKVDLPPGTPPPAHGNEYRGCATCGDVIEVPLTDTDGSRCDACAAAERDQ